MALNRRRTNDQRLTTNDQRPSTGSTEYFSCKTAAAGHSIVSNMRWLPAGIALLLAGVCLAADTPPAAAPPLCSNSAGAPACHGPKKDLKAARQAFARGLKLEKSQNLDQAFYEFEEAARLVPQNVEYLTAREMTRQHLAGLHLEHGNSDLLAGRQVERACR